MNLLLIGFDCIFFFFFLFIRKILFMKKIQDTRKYVENGDSCIGNFRK